MGETLLGQRALDSRCLSRQLSNLDPPVFISRYSETTAAWLKDGQTAAAGTSTLTAYSDDCTHFYKTLGVRSSHITSPARVTQQIPSQEEYIPLQIASF